MPKKTAQNKSAPRAEGEAWTPRVTLRDIANHLSISHVAVSLALRDKPGVSEALRATIKETAKRMDYRPDPSLLALTNYRHKQHNKPITASLGWLTLWRDPKEMHAFRELHAYWEGAKAFAYKNGYSLYEFYPNEKNSLAAAERVMRARNIEGLLISPPSKEVAQNLPGLNWDRFCCVRFGHGLSSLGFHMVTSAHDHNAKLAMNRMRERGYRRIGFITTRYANATTQFLDGILRANADLPPEERIPPLSLQEKSSPMDKKATADWLRRHSPDAIFSNLGNIKERLSQLGYTVPKQLGLAVSSIQDCDADSGINQSAYEIGQAACETLIAQVMHRNWGIPKFPREILVKGKWVNGTDLPARTQD